MREPITVDPDLEPMRISRRVLDEMRQHAREAHPEECCGLVSGVSGDRFRVVYRCQNDMTLKHEQDPEAYPRTSRDGYYMNEVGYFDALKDAESRGERITAVYHSHVGVGAYLPGLGAYLSAMDQEYAEQPLFPFPDALQIVIDVPDGNPKGQAIFERKPEAGVYVGRKLEPGSP